MFWKREEYVDATEQLTAARTSKATRCSLPAVDILGTDNDVR